MNLIMKTRRFCPHCGRPVVKSHNDRQVNRYRFQCFGCDEDFGAFEVLRKKDLPKIKSIRQNAYLHEHRNGLPHMSFTKPYQRRK